jgi:hypothetical protein
MIEQDQQERVTYEFWRKVREQLAESNLSDPDAAVEAYLDFLREKEIPWDLVYHEGVSAVAKSILDADGAGHRV